MIEQIATVIAREQGEQLTVSPRYREFIDIAQMIWDELLDGSDELHEGCVPEDSYRDLENEYAALQAEVDAWDDDEESYRNGFEEACRRVAAGVDRLLTAGPRERTTA